MPHLRCAACYERIEAGYEEALTIELASHLESAHGRSVSLAEIAPVVRRTMTPDARGGGGLGTQLWIARAAAILVGLFFLLHGCDHQRARGQPALTAGLPR